MTSTMARASGSHYTSEMTRRQLVRAIIASTIGTTIEWYDILVYGLLANLAIAPLFFPSRDALASALAGNLALLASFLARPLGGFVFGVYGDRVGRKSALIATLVMAGGASCLIGLLPTYDQVGVLAPVGLLVLRVLVGAGLGGEWTGSVLLSVEWGAEGRRGLYGAWPQISVALATAIALLVIAGSSLIFGVGSMWAWRTPFLLSAALLLVGLYVRLSVLETPTFQRLLESRRIEREPVRTVLREHLRDVVAVALLKVGEQAPVVMLGTFLLVYLPVGLHLSRWTTQSVLLVSTPFAFTLPLLFGYVSDRVGRRRVFALGAISTAIWMVLFFPLLATRDIALIVLAVVVAQCCAAAMSGPEAALVAETFTGRLRYSGAGIGASTGAFLAGVTAPLSVYLFQSYRQPMPIGIYLAVWAMVSLLAAGALRDRRDWDIAVDYDEAKRLPTAAATETTR